MLITGLILAPIATATVAPAVQDLADLTSIINAAADTIGDTNSTSRGFGFSSASDSSQMGTADLVNNITSTILRGKFQLDTNKTKWLSSTNVVNVSVSINETAAPPPTLSLKTSLAAPTVVPNATLTFCNLTTDLTAPYLEYVQALPNLSSSLVALGRRFHREMNAPVSEAIGALQQSLAAFQTAMLGARLITSLAVIRTIRASGRLEDAQTAWDRPLNLPSGPVGDDGDDGVGDTPGTASSSSEGKTVQARRAPPKDGMFYTHQELWNRSGLRSTKIRGDGAKVYDGIARSDEGQRAGQARVLARRFVV